MLGDKELEQQNSWTNLRWFSLMTLGKIIFPNF